MPILAAIWVSVPVSGPAMAQQESCDGPVCLTRAERDGRIILSARNSSTLQPVTVALSLDLDGMSARERGPQVLPPGERRRLAALRPDRSGATFGYSLRWVPGDAGAVHAPPQPYRLPWAAGTYRVVQSCGGWFSHRGDTVNAVDFGLTKGTPVMAARAGRVVEVRMGETRGGNESALLGRENRIIIAHADGTMALYAHLAARSERVALGEAVVPGQMLALSGNTGLSTGPHLHLEVFSPRLDGGRRTWPIPFDSAEGAVTCPTEGALLTVR